ncbi:branched-chain amino acid ABC transporter ATP-binding protein/permease [Devosia faecipullorum]|uniref:branched-chain amino acid ABC transporter ATP-binding protein/permease n=1 Tax=Devosia faecipullorum TaxID=2755039 RepID=UPI00187B440E|nr:branched-chain amino acid ABC transporter ATP-binding protein/permease [Devosia faecipullorum]MBE7734284.1 branched-chain amino acid ABC transporter ATP-binding protein/permease [Devosia faecipullorum]
MTILRSLLPVFIIGALYLATAMMVTNSYHQLLFTLVLVWACFGLAWNMLSGYTGLISFGHGAFFGLGAYATVLAQINFGISPIIMIPVSGLIGAAAGLLIGLPTFRLRGHYFALSMLAYPLAMVYVFDWLGYQEVTFPLVRENAAWFMQFSDPRVYTIIALLMLLAFVIVTRMVERSRFGMSLIAIKQNEAAAEAAGINTLEWKLKAIALSGGMAGMVGAFYSIVLLVVTPQSVFGMLVSAQALTVAMFGGVGTVWGPIIGAAFIIPVADILHAELGSSFPGIQGVLLGIAIVLVILIAPEGVFWKVRDHLARRKGGAPADAAATVEAAAAEAAYAAAGSAEVAPKRVISDEVILDVRNISKSFGGLKAVQNVSFEVRRGMILGIIGPNGAGKTTLFNLLNGFIKPDQGNVIVKGVEMVGKRPHALASAGVGRTFQVMRPFMRMTVAQNVKVGAYVRATSEAHAEELAAEAVRRVGLANVAGELASALTTKQLRLMELARALAGQPEILLLDETLAGLGHSEVGDVVDAIKSLADEGVTIVIIEHTMQAMVRLVDEFLVLDHGEVLLQGEPLAVTKDRRVVEAYLGKKWSENA